LRYTCWTRGITRAIEEAAMTEKTEPVRHPVVGYDAHGRPKTFQLREGEKLPEGYSDAPPAHAHPNVPKDSPEALESAAGAPREEEGGEKTESKATPPGGARPHGQQGRQR
jgi:hypothetical protein